jgi:hypothetical protein
VPVQRSEGLYNDSDSPCIEFLPSFCVHPTRAGAQEGGPGVQEGGGDNFIKIHRTLRVTPAMAAGVTSKLWEVSDLVALLEESESKKAA